MYQYQKKGKEYLNGFLFKRVMPLYLVCIIFIAFYACTNIAFGETVKIENVVQSFLFGGTIISKGWYLQSIILWYVLFFLSFNFVKNDNIKLALLLLSFVLYVVLCLCLELGSTWYEGCFSLLLGVAFAKWKEKIDRALSTRYILYLILLLSLFAVTFVFGNSSLLGTAMRIISKCISASLFPMIVVLLLQYVKINNIITAFLGKLYLEIYILHGFFLQICYSKYITIKNPLLYGVTVFTGTIVASLIIHPGLQKILALGRTKGKKVGK